MPFKIFISTSSFGASNTAPLELLRSHGVEIILNPYGRKLTREECLSLYSDIEGLLAGTETLDAPVLERAKKLKAISRCGAGVDNVDLSAAESLGIKIFSTPDAPTQAVAELTIALMLDALRRISQQDAEMKRGVWRKRTGNLLAGKTVGILGLGRIGRRVVELLAPFGVKILCREQSPDTSFVSGHGVMLASLEETLSTSDIVSIHLPGAPALRHMIGERELKLMKPDAVLVNTARGGLVDEEALFSALNEGRIRMAALDVFEREPYQGPLSGLENVILTPHVASSAEETRIAMETEAAENLLKGLGL